MLSYVIYLQIFSYYKVRKNIYFIVHVLSVVSKQFNILAKKLIKRNRDIYSSKYFSIDPYTSEEEGGITNIVFDSDEELKKKHKRELIFNLYWANPDSEIHISDFCLKMKHIDMIKKYQYIEKLDICVNDISEDVLLNFDISNVRKFMLSYNIAQSTDFGKLKLDKLTLRAFYTACYTNINGLDKAQIRKIDISDYYNISNSVIEQLSNNIYLKVLKLSKSNLEKNINILKKNKIIKEVVVSTIIFEK